MLREPQRKYRPFPAVDLPERAWPSRVIKAPPVWLSTDLRDGNQALFEPMDAGRKRELFALLCTIGFKEIEVGFPSASQTDFDFVRQLIEEDLVPPDVTIGVLTPARIDLIDRSVAALHGARRAIVHVYNAISPVFREVVFRKNKASVVALACDGVLRIKELTRALPETQWVLQYSPETFSAAELEFSREICDAVMDAWNPQSGEKIIINLPATVEMSTPNIFADQVEWMHRHLARRDAIVLSVHPHNDRGTGVAAAELALMAGADRVEGCLFGNGERTGNVDLVTLALNLYTQGIAPGLDFSRIDQVARIVSDCIRLPLSPRHPYVGELVYTAFSGSHQDAIKKGLAAQRPGDLWSVPYLPLDPFDVGRDYEAVIRVNSQSGKGGVAYLLETHYGVILPRRMLIAFSRLIKDAADRRGGEMTAQEVWAAFAAEYLQDREAATYRGHELSQGHDGDAIRLCLEAGGQVTYYEGRGNGPLDAAVHALPVPVRLRHYEERAMGSGSPADAMAIIEIEVPEGGSPVFGVGIHSSIMTASLIALVRAWASGLARHEQRFGVPQSLSVGR
ncbi:MAG: 2-isopropylmalate synthase [Acidiferrobacter sp.]